MTEQIRVVVTGAYGKMGREVVKSVVGDPTLKLVGAVDVKGKGIDAGYLAGIDPVGVAISTDLEGLLNEVQADVLIDFTNPQAVLRNIQIALNKKVCPVVGTTGMTEVDRQAVAKLAEEVGVGVVIAPNFALGAVLMMRFAKEAARYFPHVEIIELHHDQKVDAPSGTALRTAELISEERKPLHQGAINEYEKIKGVRGGNFEGMRIHSIRLPGLVAHQEVILGGNGQTLSIRHDSIHRESFMPGVLLAVHKVQQVKGVIYGLENLLDL